MSLNKLKKEIKLNIGASNAAYRGALARQLIEEQVPIKEIIDIILEEHPVSTRFSWLLGDILLQSPERSKEILIECYKKKDQINITNFDRSLSKQILVCGHNLPIDLEGKLVTHLFEWLMDPKILVSTKNNCLFALENLCKKYPELKGEFIEIVKEQKEVNSQDFKERAKKVLLRLEK